MRLGKFVSMKDTVSLISSVNDIGKIVSSMKDTVSLISSMNDIEKIYLQYERYCVFSLQYELYCEFDLWYERHW